MKHRFIFLLAAVVLVSCNRRIKGNGDFIEESRTAGSFTSVVSAGDFDVILTPGATGSIKIYGESNIVSRIKTEVDGGELTINFSNSSRRYEHDGVKIYVTSNGVSNVDLQGSGSIVSEDNLMANSLHTNLSGSGNVSLKYNGGNASAELSGSGNIDLSGQATNASYTVSGSGNVNALGLSVRFCNANISGSGNIMVNVDSILNANISGSGNVRFVGNPDFVNPNISGSGTVTPY